jgi:tetratricopeptide (TPR) repeat protein
MIKFLTWKRKGVERWKGLGDRSRLNKGTMRNQSFIVASIAALLMFGASTSAQAQQQSQPVPDAPQPQKKPAAKPPATDSSSPADDKTDSKQPPSTKDDNAFPEAVSKAAAKASGSSDSDPAQAGDTKPAAKDDNAFPEAVSKAAAKAAAGSSDSDPAPSGDAKPPTKDDNPFPEAVSRDAAKAAGHDSVPAPDAKRDIPPGVSSSSSQSSGTEEDEPGSPPTVVDPARAKKDADVAGFYLKTGNYQGALLRYKDATASDPANVEAIFGLAEAQRMLKKNAEAARNYQLYLDIVPNGPKAKQAIKALKVLPPTG